MTDKQLCLTWVLHVVGDLHICLTWVLQVFGDKVTEVVVSLCTMHLCAAFIVMSLSAFALHTGALCQC